MYPAETSPMVQLIQGGDNQVEMIDELLKDSDWDIDSCSSHTNSRLRSLENIYLKKQVKTKKV